MGRGMGMRGNQGRQYAVLLSIMLVCLTILLASPPFGQWPKVCSLFVVSFDFPTVLEVALPSLLNTLLVGSLTQISLSVIINLRTVLACSLGLVLYIRTTRDNAVSFIALLLLLVLCFSLFLSFSFSSLRPP